MIKSKVRYSFPGKIYDLLFTDEKFVQELSKLKKVETSFPRYDQWRDSSGFNMSFALAGYSNEDITIKVKDRQLFISAEGMSQIFEEPREDEGAILRPTIHKGIVSRGIARRSFRLAFYISDEFDLSNIKARMEHGLLSIVIRDKEVQNEEIIINIEGE